MDILIFLALIGVLAVMLDAFVFHKFIQTKETGTDELDKLRAENDLLKEQNTRLQVELEKKTELSGELEAELKMSESEKNELSGKNKQMFVSVTTLQEQNKNLQSQADELNKKVIQHESHKEQKDKAFEQRVADLEESRKALLDEKARIRREDEERLAREEEERNRIWNEHENVSIARMKEICVKPELGFIFYENTTLPEEFDGKLKPDFLVEFLGQYIIFDAKMTRTQSRSLQDYIQDQVKSTAKKILESKNKNEIYPSVFFVVPQDGIATLKKTAFYEEGFSFFVISIEAVEPVLLAYKKVTHYELAENFDPKERENIINLIAAFDQHIARQNAVNILTALEGLKVSQLKQGLKPDMQEDVEIKRKNIRLDNFKPTDLKRLMNNPSEQIDEMKKLIIPSKPAIGQTDIEEASQTLF